MEKLIKRICKWFRRDMECPQEPKDRVDGELLIVTKGGDIKFGIRMYSKETPIGGYVKLKLVLVS